jgi:group I intron endonuclease
MTVSGIYSIAHGGSGKCYVGSAMNITRRWWTHTSQMRAGKHANQKLQRSWNKYGEGSFTFSILEAVDDAANLVPREQFWMDKIRPFFNISPTAGSPLGVKHTKEARENMGRSRLGRKLTDAHKKKLSIAMTGKVKPPEGIALHKKSMTGRKQSPEHIAKRAKAMTGRKLSAEQIEKMSAAQRGIPKSDEMKRKMSIAHTGKKLSAEHIEKVVKALTGRFVSDETKAKIGAANKGRKHGPCSDEKKASMSSSMMGRIWTKDELLRRSASRARNKIAASSLIAA